MQNQLPDLFFQRARAANRAISWRLSGVKAAARAFPPLFPPQGPKRNGVWVLSVIWWGIFGRVRRGSTDYGCRQAV